MKCKVFKVTDLMKLVDSPVFAQEQVNGEVQYCKEPIGTLKELPDGKYKPCSFQGDTLIMIECPKGIVICDNEAIGIAIPTGEALIFQLNEAPIPTEKGFSFKVFNPAVGLVKADSSKLSEVINTIGERTLDEHVRRFGSRIESNFDGIVRSIVELGGDRKDFPRSK